MDTSLKLLSRRDLFRHAATAAGFACGYSAFAPLFAAAESRGFKIGGCDWSLGKRGDPAALDVAKQIGLDGVQADFGTMRNKMRLRTAEHQAADPRGDGADRAGRIVAGDL